MCTQQFALNLLHMLETTKINKKLFKKNQQHHSLLVTADRGGGTPSNFVFKLTMLTVETLSCFAVKTM